VLQKYYKLPYYFFELFDGFKLGLLPGVLLLSLRRWSSLPVDFATGFGPGFNPILFYLPSINLKTVNFE